MNLKKIGSQELLPSKLSKENLLLCKCEGNPESSHKNKELLVIVQKKFIYGYDPRQIWWPKEDKKTKPT